MWRHLGLAQVDKLVAGRGEAEVRVAAVRSRAPLAVAVLVRRALLQREHVAVVHVPAYQVEYGPTQRTSALGGLASV